MTSIIFFGSFQHYSVQILDALFSHPDYQITLVVTTPPRPGDRGVLTKTAVQIFAEAHNLPVFCPEKLDELPPVDRPDFIIVAGYGYLIPANWLNFAKIMALNIHPSLLPGYAGRFPAEWAILNGETTTGTTIIQMSEKFDRGAILAQKTLPIDDSDTRETLYTKLYTLSSELLLSTLPKIISGQITPLPQATTGFYARQISREDGYISNLDDYETLNRQLRALHPWPGVWTYVKDKSGNKLTMKIFSASKNNKNVELENVQIEGKKPALWSQISEHYSLIS